MGLLQRELKPDRAALTNNLVHWGTGLAWGAIYGIFAGSLPSPRLRYGLLFAPLVWASGYVALPAAGLYKKSIWEYEPKTLGKDLSAHLGYGMGTAAAFAALARH